MIRMPYEHRFPVWEAFDSGGTTKVLLQYLDIPMGGDAKPLDIHHGRFWRSMHSINNRAPSRFHHLSSYILAVFTTETFVYYHMVCYV